MAAPPEEEENDLNFFDTDSGGNVDDGDDEDNGEENNMVLPQRPRPVIAHKDISRYMNMQRDGKSKAKTKDFESISPPVYIKEKIDEKEEGEMDSNDDNDDGDDDGDNDNGGDGGDHDDDDNEKAFEPISPDEKFEQISPPASPKDNNVQFENISDDEGENKQDGEEMLLEGKFSPVQSDNELNFDDESSNDSGYQIVKPAVSKKTKGTEGSENDSSQSAETGENKDEGEIEAPVPSPFSDIGDPDDMPDAEGRIINDILNASSVANEQDFIANRKGSTTDMKSKQLNDDANKNKSFPENEKKKIYNEDTNESKKNMQIKDQTITENKPTEYEKIKEEKGKAEEAGKNDDDLIADIFGESDEEEEFAGFDVEEEEAEEDEEEDQDKPEPVKAVSKKDEESSDDEMPQEKKESDFDVMMRKRKEMNRQKRRSKTEEIINDNDDIIVAMIGKMKDAAEEDRMLNQCGKAATKKMKLLPIVSKQLKKADLISTFIDCGLLPAVKDWLTPLPDHSLPHVNIRKTFLRMLLEFPPLDKGALKVSGIGRAVMLLFKHPKETVENKRMAGKIISSWARPIFNVSSNFNDMSREDREDRDKSNIPEAKRRRLSSAVESSKNKLDDVNDNQPHKPGDKGWIGRARVPMPSHRDYVNRPQSKIDYDVSAKGNTKKAMTRYEKQVRKLKVKKTVTTGMKTAVAISLNGSKLAL